MPVIASVVVGYLAVLLALAWVVLQNVGRRPDRADYELVMRHRVATVAPSVHRRHELWLVAFGVVMSAVLAVVVVPGGRRELSAAVTTPMATTAPLAVESTPTPVITATPTSTVVSAGRYTVIAGDTLTGIAARLGVTTGSLLQANQLSNPDQLAVGQVLIVPVR